jgi:hypothetical protein
MAGATDGTPLDERITSLTASYELHSASSTQGSSL